MSGMKSSQIHKYKIPLNKSPLRDPRIQFVIPKHTEILPTILMQGDNLCFWGIVPESSMYMLNKESKPEDSQYCRTFVVVGTGETFNNINMKYIGTVQDGLYIWHLFEEKVL